jgi:probable rRNA maturation factor
MSERDQPVEVQFALAAAGLPTAEQIRGWAMQALQEQGADAELTVRIVDTAEITALNLQFRGKDGATNVLSFPHEVLPGLAPALLGDVVICAPVVASEAVAQGKPLEAHWAHMVIHGVLHLLGHDHHQEAGARAMETLETRLLAGLGFPDPY